jgi:hypothetical protein
VENKNHYRYVSATYINEILNIMAQQVLLNIINCTKEAGIYSILVDETQDLFRHEQFSIIIRFVNDLFQIQEKFLGFYKTSHTDSETLVIYYLLLCYVYALHSVVAYIGGRCGLQPPPRNVLKILKIILNGISTFARHSIA